MLVVIEPIGAAMTPFVPFATAIACANVQVLLPGVTLLSFVTVMVPACATPEVHNNAAATMWNFDSTDMDFPLMPESAPNRQDTPAARATAKRRRIAGRYFCYWPFPARDHHEYQVIRSSRR
ncbi:MAG TPA: hypothetical protein VLS52_02655 [Rudaea sp.]|nr:hypothetical protein [Rudaea sp.]